MAGSWLKGQTVLSGPYAGPSSVSGNYIINASGSATFSSGYTFQAATNLTLGNYATLNWSQNGTIAGTAITAGTTAGAYGAIVVGTNDSLTLDSATSMTGDIYLYSNNAGSTIINQGTITQNSGMGYLYGQTFTNANGGVIQANASSNLYIGYYSGETITNASGGTITANGTNANIYFQNIINNGTINATNNGALYFQGANNTTGNLGSVVLASGGQALLQGTFDNTSATLTAPTGGPYELYGGTINNGTIAAGALTFTSNGGALNNVSYTGDFNLPASTTVSFTGGSTTFTGSNLTLGNYSTFNWNQNGTLTGKTVTSGTTAGNYAYIDVGTNNSLTLGSTTSLTGDIYLYSSNSGSTITNQGTITQNSGTGYIYGPTVTNASGGTITANAGSNLYFGYYSGETMTNASGGTITANGSNANVYLQNIINNGTLNAQNGGIL